MAVDPSLALATLKQLIPPGSDYDDPSGDVKLLGLQQQRQDEYAKNLAKQGDGFYPAATPVDLKQASDDIADNPITKQQTFLDAMTKANQTAQAAGFGGDPNSPVAQQRLAGQQSELQKLLMPEQVKGQYALQEEQLKGQQAKELAAQQAQAQQDQMAAYQGSSTPNDSSKMNHLVPSFGPKGTTWSTQQVPAQVQLQTEGANAANSAIGQMRSSVDKLDQAGWLGPVWGPVGAAAASHGFDWLMPDRSRTISDMNTQRMMLNLAIPKLVAGTARAAGASAIQKLLDDRFNAAQTKEDMNGVLDAYSRWANNYADPGKTGEPIEATIQHVLGGQ